MNDPVSSHDATPQQNGNSLSDVLANAAGEVKMLETITENLQRIIGDALPHGGKSGLQNYELQNLDLLNQSLGNLAMFLSSLSQMTPHEWCVDVQKAVSDITLLDMADRLTSAEQSDAAAETQYTAGECDLFDEA